MLTQLSPDRGAQLVIDSQATRPGTSSSQVSLPVGEPRLITTIGLAVAGDLSIDGLIALADPSSYGLHRLAGGKTIGDLDAVILGQVAATDWLVDEVHAASVDEPQRPAARRHADRQRRGLGADSLPYQREEPTLGLGRGLVPCSVGHRESFRPRFATTIGICRVYPVIFIDAIVVKVRDGQVVNRPIYVVIGVTVNGERDILGLWAGDGSEGAKFWLAVLTEIKNRGVEDVCIAVCDGLKGLPESINTTWQYTKVQACILHLIRNTFRYASRKDWDELARDLRPVYTAPSAEMAGVRFDEFADKWGARYPAIINLWRSAWEEFIVFLDYDVEIRKIICSTNAIESLNARYRRAVRARGHFPTDQAALKCLYLVTRSLDPTGRGRARWTMRWKPALNAFAITFAGRIVPSTTN
jgi:hypothetical protein